MLWFQHHLEVTNVTLGCIRQRAFPGSVCPVTSLSESVTVSCGRKIHAAAESEVLLKLFSCTSCTLVHILNVLVTGRRFEGLGGLNFSLHGINYHHSPLSSSRQRSPGRYSFSMTASASFSLSRLFWLFCRLFLLAESSPVRSNKRAMNASPSRRM